MIPPNSNYQPENQLRGLPPNAEIVYTPTQKAELNNKVAGIVAMVVGGVFAIFGFIFGVLLFFIFTPLAVIPCLIMVLGITVAALFGRKVFVSQSQRLHLSPHSLRYFSSANQVELPLRMISRLSLQPAAMWRTDNISKIQYRVNYWLVRIETTAGGFIDLDVTQENYLGTFDVPRILNDLLPRLSPSTQIDPRIRTYLQTGRIA